MEQYREQFVVNLNGGNGTSELSLAVSCKNFLLKRLTPRSDRQINCVEQYNIQTQ